jgi:hypothetical protein
VGIYLKHNWFVDNVFICSAKFVCQAINIIPYFRKVCEFFSWNFLGENTVGLYILSSVIETKFQWSSGNDTIASWKEIETDD